MFGTLKPHRCALPADDRQTYTRLYCGTCKGLGTHYGQASRGLLSYDAVLLAALAEGLEPEPSAHGTARCPINPLSFRPILAPDSRAMRYASAAQLVLVDQWVEDKASDGQALGWLRPLVRGTAARAAQDLRALGLAPERLAGLNADQVLAEQSGDLDAVVAPTAEVVAHLFAGLGDGEALGNLGRRVGEVVYWIDALEDLERDQDRGDFNPCLREGRVDGARLAEVSRRLRTAVSSLPEAVDAVTAALFRNQGVVEHVLCERLPQRAAKALQAARQVPAAPRTAYERAVAWLVSVRAWLWTRVSGDKRISHGKSCRLQRAAIEGFEEDEDPYETPHPPPKKKRRSSGSSCDHCDGCGACAEEGFCPGGACDHCCCATRHHHHCDADGGCCDSGCCSICGDGGCTICGDGCCTCCGDGCCSVCGDGCCCEGCDCS